jgi:hypothetical protein
MDLLVRGVVLALLLAIAPPAGAAAAETAPDAAIKAAFLFNFAKFTEWPALAPGAPLIACIANDDDIASALVTIVRGESIGGHSVVVWRREGDALWEGCQVLYVGDGEGRHFAAAAPKLRLRPLLTVSAGRGFSQQGGAIELYVEGGRLRFSINLDAVERAGLHISSRLLGLAKVVHDDPAR